MSTAPEEKSYYEVIYNTCYGGYGFSDEFAEELFRRYPPHTETGSKLFEKVNNAYTKFCMPGATPDPEWQGSYYLIDEKREPIPGLEDYYYLYTTNFFKGTTYSEKPRKSGYITRDYKTYYFLTTREHDWRVSPEVIALAKERDLFSKVSKTGKKDRRVTELDLAKVPHGYEYRIREYDGMESVSIVPPTSDILTNLLAYIDNRDDSALHPMAKRLINKEITVREFLYPKIADE